MEASSGASVSDDVASTETEYDELLYLAWGLIANASEGVWENETQEWQDAAVRWRDRWHAYLDARH